MIAARMAIFWQRRMHMEPKGLVVINQKPRKISLHINQDKLRLDPIRELLAYGYLKCIKDNSETVIDSIFLIEDNPGCTHLLILT